MLVLLYNDNIINDEELHMPMKIEQTVLNKLSENVRNKLKNVSILQCIRHEAGLKNYMDNYHNKLIISCQEILKYMKNNMDLMK